MNYKLIGSILLSLGNPLKFLIKWNVFLILITNNKVQVSIFLIVMVNDLISTEHTLGKKGIYNYSNKSNNDLFKND